MFVSFAGGRFLGAVRDLTDKTSVLRICESMSPGKDLLRTRLYFKRLVLGLIGVPKFDWLPTKMNHFPKEGFWASLILRYTQMLQNEACVAPNQGIYIPVGLTEKMSQHSVYIVRQWNLRAKEATPFQFA